MPRWWSKPKHCITFKGALKFASTVHICIGVIFWYFLITLLKTIIHKSKLPNTSAPLMGLQYFLYFFLFLPLAVAVHRGVKKESVPILQWSGALFVLLQIYGGLTQYQYRFAISDFLADSFPELVPESVDILLEIGIALAITAVYLLVICFYVRKLKSHFYVPPVYPSRVEYFYYPEDTSANITVFHKQVPCTIMNNSQSSAYFVQKELKDSPSCSRARGSPGQRRSQRQGPSRSSASSSTLPNGRISMPNCKPW